MHANAIQHANEDEVLINLNDLPSAKAEGWQYTPLKQRIKNLSLASVSGNTDIERLDSQSIQRVESGSKDAKNLLSNYIKSYKNTLNNNILFNFSNILNEELIHLNCKENGSIELINEVASDSAYAPVIIMNVQANCQIELYETLISGENAWLNACLLVNLGKNASFKHYRASPRSSSVVTALTHLNASEGANYGHYSLSGRGEKSLYRQELVANVHGAHVNIDINALNLLKDNEISDLTVTINHENGESVSQQTVKTIVTDKAKGVFQGKVYVAKDAQKTNANQMSRAILLSRLAEMDTKPELEIYADDVECAHGATTGQLDKHQLFYLRSRGIPEKDAKSLLLEAFAKELLEKFESDNFREQAQKWLDERLQGMDS